MYYIKPQDITKNEKYGRSTEELEALEKKIGNCFNESEVTVDHSEPQELIEPDIAQINPPSAPEGRRPKKGTRESMIRKLPHRDDPPYEIPEDKRVCSCGGKLREIGERHFANAVKALSKKHDRVTELTVLGEALRLIGEIFHLDKSWKGASFEERLYKRQIELKPKIDDYFEWVESKVGTVPPKSETGKGLRYSLNQKQYLLGALSNPDAPLDNSQAERSIRNFVISRKNFVLIDTLTGAEASAIMFSMSETAKANGLKPYNYFEHLLTELPKHMKDNSRDMRFLDELLPWSRSLPESIRKEVKQ